MSLTTKPYLNVATKLTMLVVMCIGINGCAVSMMSHQDEKTIERIEQFDKDINSLLITLEEQDAKKPACLYQNHADSYKNLRVQLRSMAMYEKIKPKNERTYKQVQLLQKRLGLLIKDHKRICQPGVAAALTRQQINDMVEHMLYLETHKRSRDNKN